MRKVAIVGSRDFPNLKLVEDFVDSLEPGSTVISGHARGVDITAELRAKQNKLNLVSIKADWARNKRGAGFMRNGAIVELADEVVAFWDGRSRGTLSTLRIAREAGKPLTIYSPGGKVRHEI